MNVIFVKIIGNFFRKMNLADPELELIDPTPNIHNLFVHFDSVFFWTSLVNRAIVRWSKRMYSCAGVCSYEGRNGLCNIALSEPLLKLRPRKDLIETLLHEMIHAYLFITNRDNDRDGHGPNFKAHMYRINRATGLKISIYHDFHDEVELYLKHWWRCNGPCTLRKPYFGIVRRSSNRAPGPNDYWWNSHQRNCGGTFTKIKEPEQVKKQSQKNSQKEKNKDNRIQKSIDGFVDKAKVVKTKDITVELTPKIHITGSNDLPSRISTDISSITEKVREVWRNKHLPTTINGQYDNTAKKTRATSETNKHKIEFDDAGSSPKKMKTIDDYFKSTASTILKDLYGKELEVVISSSNKIKAVSGKECTVTDLVNKVTKDRPNGKNKNVVDCPNCKAKVNETEINRHLDECLNRDIIETLSKDNISVMVPNKTDIDNKNKLKNIVATVQNNPMKAEPILIKSEAIIKKENKHKLNEQTSTQDMNLEVKIEPGPSKDLDQSCPCCGQNVGKPIQEHLDECIAFQDTSIEFVETPVIETIVIEDDDDEFDETINLNPLGTKSPCPCCLKLVEIADMNDHLDVCLGS